MITEARPHHPQDTSTQSSDLLESSVLGLDLDGVSVSDTVLDLSVDGNVWSSGGLSSSWCSGLLADGDSSGLDSTVTQSNNLSSDLVGWCIGGWSRSYLHGSGGSLSLANWLNGDEDLGTVVSSRIITVPLTTSVVIVLTTV